MSPSVRVDSEVYATLQKRAEPFVDTPNSVLRRLLGLDNQGEAPSLKSRGKGSSAKPKARPTKPRRSPRAPSGALLPEQAYVEPILDVLKDSGGSMSTGAVIEAVGRRLEKQLKPLDWEQLTTGGIRWQNRVQFVRLRLVDEGLLSKGAPRGVWVLTDKGKERVAEMAAAGE